MMRYWAVASERTFLNCVDRCPQEIPQACGIVLVEWSNFIGDWYAILLHCCKGSGYLTIGPKPPQKHWQETSPRRMRLLPMGLSLKLSFFYQEAQGLMKISTAFCSALHRLNHDEETGELPVKIVEKFGRQVYGDFRHDDLLTEVICLVAGE